MVNNHAFYTEDNAVRTPIDPTGFPSIGIINSALTSGLSYKIQDYNSENALFLNGVSNGTLTITTPDSYANLYILATSANGSSDIGIQINFTDGSDMVLYPEIPYWYTDDRVAYSDLGLIHLDSNFIEESHLGPPRLHEIFIDLSAYSDRYISSMDIYNYRLTQAAVFAISSYTRDLILPALSNETVDINDIVTTLNATPSEGAGSYTYQWFINDTNDTTTPTVLVSENNAVYTPSSSTAGTFYYFCTVTETTGDTRSSNTNVMTLTVNPIIVENPETGENNSNLLLWNLMLLLMCGMYILFRRKKYINLKVTTGYRV